MVGDAEKVIARLAFLSTRDPLMSKLRALVGFLAAVRLVCAQPGPVRPLPNTFPHDYPGKPSGDFSPAWQSCTCRIDVCLSIAL